MRKSILILSLLALSFTACKNDAKKETENTKTEMTAKAEYACPMKCEGDKTYHEAGQCPKCGMDLKKMDMKHNDNHSH